MLSRCILFTLGTFPRHIWALSVMSSPHRQSISSTQPVAQQYIYCSKYATTKLTYRISVSANHFLYSASIRASIDVSWTLRRPRSSQLEILSTVDGMVGRCQLEKYLGRVWTTDDKGYYLLDISLTTTKTTNSRYLLDLQFSSYHLSFVFPLIICWRPHFILSRRIPLFFVWVHYSNPPCIPHPRLLSISISIKLSITVYISFFGSAAISIYSNICFTCSANLYFLTYIHLKCSLRFTLIRVQCIQGHQQLSI